MQQAKGIFTDVEFKTDMYAAADGADALVVITEWDEFRHIDLDKLADLLKQKCVIDLRNIYKRQVMKNAGFAYLHLSRAAVDGGTEEVKDLLAV